MVSSLLAKSRALKKQCGYFMVGMSIAMLAASIGIIGSSKVALRNFSASNGVFIGNQLQTISNGLSSYISANSAALSLATPAVAGVANPLKPTIAELLTLKHLSPGVSYAPTLGGAYNTQITVSPTGCTSNCLITGAVWLGSPIYSADNKTADITLLGSAVSASPTSQVGAALPASPTLITGPGWSVANPDPAKRAGILYAQTAANKSAGASSRCAAYSVTNKIDCTNDTQLISNTTGNMLTAIGIDALKNNTTGIHNSASGYQALYNNTTGNMLTANGSSALYSNTTGNYNAASGYQALYKNTTGSYNTANGSSALYSNTTGSYNIASGSYALFGNTTGSYNIAIGSQALWKNTTGSYNAASGSFALISNTTGSYNSAYGSPALNRNTTGSYNSASGYNALDRNTTGNYNAASGYQALYNNTTGIQNTAVGADSGPLTGDLSNSISIGYLARASGSNTARIGNDAITQIGGAVAWSNISDHRLKKDIVTSDRGMDFVRQLRPVDYVLKGNGKSETGFIAQEVEKIDVGFPGVNKPQNEADFYSLTYTDFIPAIVKSIQQLDARTSSLRAFIIGMFALIGILAVALIKVMRDLARLKLEIRGMRTC